MACLASAWSNPEPQSDKLQLDLRAVGHVKTSEDQHNRRNFLNWYMSYLDEAQVAGRTRPNLILTCSLIKHPGIPFTTGKTLHTQNEETCFGGPAGSLAYLTGLRKKILRRRSLEL